MFGGDDEIEGGDGGDIVTGDGIAECNFTLIDGFTCGDVIGGNDEIEGGNGDDTLIGDGVADCDGFMSATSAGT